MYFKKLTTVTGALFTLIGLIFASGPTSAIIRTLGLPPFPTSAVKEWMLVITADPYLRLWGITLLGFGLLVWSIRNLNDAKLQANIILAVFIAFALGSSVFFSAQWMHRTTAAKIMFILYAVFAVAYGYLLFDRKKSNQIYSNEPHTEIREQWAQQISAAAAQQERNRLARDLHDAIKQQLFNINISAATAQTRWETDHDGALAMLTDV